MLYIIMYAFLYSYSVLIDAGSRYEVDHPSGLSHVIEKMGFKVRTNILVAQLVTNLSLKMRSSMCLVSAYNKGTLR